MKAQQSIDPWERVKSSLRQELPEASFQSWFGRTQLVATLPDCLVVEVPDVETKEWIEQEFQTQLNRALVHSGVPFSRVEFRYGSQPANGNGANTAPRGFDGPESSPMNPRYTFSSFIVGTSNQFAHAASKAVAASPARSYNPLFIYSGPGMGKTHLIHAIGQELAAQFSSLKLVYTTGERFVNQLVHCVRTDQMTAFQKYYRGADVLLIDDVHVIAGKERTQEEFFHTFNELYDHQKQIVLTSDQPPANTPGLVERLRSRFEWGLLVDIQAPDLETKMAILDKKAEINGIQLPDEVRVFIATRTKSNVRELEGALVRLLAYSSTTGMPINMEMAKQVLRNLAPSPERRYSIESIIRAVADHFQMTPSLLKQKSNARQIAYPRQIAMYLVKELTTASLPEIGRAFGGKHHTTVLHSVQKIERERQVNRDLDRLINSLMDSMH